nr:EOG090X091L [Cyclestheria hislopi]
MIHCGGLNFATFYEHHPKGGYQSKEKVPTRTLIRQGLRELREEIKLWSSEWKERLECDPVIVPPAPGEVDILWDFKNNPDFDKWVVTSDSDHKEGYSTCSLNLSPAGNALFSGNLSIQPVKDGKTKRAGYCNMKSIRPMKSFKRDTYYDWTLYTHIVLRIRGDGRSYLLNIGTAGYFDVTWNDMFSYILFTRGGPYWQIVKIPFSKFFLASKGRIQDKQNPLPRNRVTSVGISAGNKVNGSFRLEIDYIGLEYDPSHTEVTAYEMYRTPKFMAGY